MRSFDDFLAGRDTGYEPAAGYREARGAEPEVEEMLDGLRYVAHKSLHALVDVAVGPPPMDMMSVSYMGPLPPPPRRVDVPAYRWPDLRWLVDLAGRDRNAAERQAYEQHLWGDRSTRCSPAPPIGSASTVLTNVTGGSR